MLNVPGRNGFGIPVSTYDSFHQNNQAALGTFMTAVSMLYGGGPKLSNTAVSTLALTANSAISNANLLANAFFSLTGREIAKKKRDEFVKKNPAPGRIEVALIRSGLVSMGLNTLEQIKKIPIVGDTAATIATNTANLTKGFVKGYAASAMGQVEGATGLFETLGFGIGAIAGRLWPDQ